MAQRCRLVLIGHDCPLARQVHSTGISECKERQRHSLQIRKRGMIKGSVAVAFLMGHKPAGLGLRPVWLLVLQDRRKVGKSSRSTWRQIDESQEDGQG